MRNFLVILSFLLQSSTSFTFPTIQKHQSNAPPSYSNFGTKPVNPFISPSLKSKHRRKYENSLYSLSQLISELEEETNSSSGSTNDPRVVFVGGKGGVGKTTVSSALAVTLSSNYATDQNVLIVSTDPAHSLGDALDCNLQQTNSGKVVPMTDPVTGGRLFACEVDPSAALEEFQSSLATFDVNKLADALGVSSTFLEGLGLQEFSTLLNNPPPGLDELVALANVLDSTSSSGQEYDVVVVDTAPTGHTLRLLSLPAFLDGLLGKLLELRMKLSGLATTMQAFFGDAEAANQRKQTLDDAVDKLEIFRKKMSNMRTRLQNPEKTSFVVVTVPTKLGVAESKRLMQDLAEQNVLVTDVVVNQCVIGSSSDGEEDEGDISDALTQYYERRKAGQQRWVGELREAIEDVSQSKEYKENGSPDPIALTEVPFFDVELVGVPALGYLAQTCYTQNPSFSHLMSSSSSSEEDAKFVICGGKGGVGKTTTSSSLAVAMASQGHDVALISTDPAHSLGDAIDMNLEGGQLVDCPLIGLPPSDGSLSVMEIDPKQALGQFKNIVDDLIGGSSPSSEENNMSKTLSDLGGIFDTLPPGTDEVVALAKVVGLLKQGKYDRIVLDTAPTGHTLRMLTTPGFIADLIDRVLKISRKINSNSMAKVRM